MFFVVCFFISLCVSTPQRAGLSPALCLVLAVLTPVVLTHRPVSTEDMHHICTTYAQQVCVHAGVFACSILILPHILSPELRQDTTASVLADDQNVARQVRRTRPALGLGLFLSLFLFCIPSFPSFPVLPSRSASATLSIVSLYVCAHVSDDARECVPE